MSLKRPPLWSSGQSSTDPAIRVRFRALPDFLRSGGSGTGSTQPREYNWGVNEVIFVAEKYYWLLIDYSDYTWRRIQITKLLNMQFSPPSRHFIPLWSKYPPQHPVLKHPQSNVPHLAVRFIVSELMNEKTLVGLILERTANQIYLLCLTDTSQAQRTADSDP
jgi:hypothetical protein